MHRLAPIKYRVLSYLIDNLFVTCIELQILYMFPNIFRPILLLPGLVYFTFLTASKWQATFGQRIFSVYVICEKSKKVGILLAMDRYLSQMMFTVSSLIIFWLFTNYQNLHFLWLIFAVLLNVFMIYWYASAISDAKKRTLHDKIFNTLVVVGRLG